MDENSALKALCRRDEGALGWFIDRYTAYVATIVNNMLLPRLAASDAEEVVADVFLALWHNAANIRSGGVRAYLGAIARTLCARSCRWRTTFCPYPSPRPSRR